MESAIRIQKDWKNNYVSKIDPPPAFGAAGEEEKADTNSDPKKKSRMLWWILTLILAIGIAACIWTGYIHYQNNFQGFRRRDKNDTFLTDIDRDNEEINDFISEDGKGRRRGVVSENLKQIYIDKGHNIARELVKKSQLSGWYHSKNYNEGDKGYVLNDAYKISGTLPSSPKAIVSLLYDNFETTSSWNSDVAFSKIINKINPSTDIVYQQTKKIAMVSSRDFVMLRHFESLDDGGYVLAWISDSWKDNVPTIKDTVRGNYSVSGWILRPSADGRRSQYDLILDVTLGFHIPFIWDSLMLDSSRNTCVYLRKKLSNL